MYLEINSDGEPVIWHPDIRLGQWCTIPNFYMRAQTSLRVFLSFLVVSIGTLLTNHLPGRAEKPKANEDFPDWMKARTEFPPNPSPYPFDNRKFGAQNGVNLLPITPRDNSFEQQNKALDVKTNDSNKLFSVISQPTVFDGFILPKPKLREPIGRLQDLRQKSAPVVNTPDDQTAKVIVQSAELVVPPAITTPIQLPPTPPAPQIPPVPQELSTPAQTSTPPEFAITPSKKSPVKDSPFRLFGWETAQPIGQDNLLLQFGGTSFNNPYDFRGGTGRQVNRSNDAALDLVYGLGNDGQLGISLAGKDDTIFANLVRPNSQLQILNNSIPIQAKWRFYNQSRLQGAIVAGAEFPAPFSALFFRPQRSIDYSQTAAGGVGVDRILAPNNSVIWGLGLPISYQATEKLSLHLNPRLSIFPSNLAVSEIQGDPNALRNAGIGFDGQGLNYYGTVAGVGVGASYSLTPNLQLSADFTQILAGKNTIESANNGSLLGTRPVWNAGLQYAPNNRTALGLYVTNRFSPTTASPTNLLAQPGGDYGVGLNVTYLPDFGGGLAGESRTDYPDKSAFWNSPTGFPSTTLPGSSVLYQLGVASQSQVSPSIRFGLADDFEVAVTHNNGNRREMPIETGVFARWGIFTDRGQTGLNGGLGLGLVRVDGADLQLGYSLYGETPFSYRLGGDRLTLHATPKLVIPAQFQGVPRVLALALGATWKVADNTQIFGGISPSLIGANQLVAGNTLAMSGSTPVYNVGVRQLFPSGNSTYGVELYYTNGAGSTGYQSVAALPSGDSQVGVRFSLLNGTPNR